MLGRELRQGTVDFVNAFIGEDLIDVAEAALLQGEKIASIILLVADIVDECHEQIQFRTAPEVIGFFGARGILNDGVGHGGHKVRIGVQPCKAVPAIRVRHIEEIDGFDIKAILFKVWRCHFKKFALGIRYDHGLGVLPAIAVAALCTAHEERNDEASRLIRAGGADAEDVVVLAGLHAVGDIGGILLRIVGTLLDASKEHPCDLPGASQFQVLGKLLFCCKAGGTVSTIRKNIKAARVSCEVIARKPAVTFLGDQAYQQKDHGSNTKAKGRKYDKEVSERVQHPDTLHLLTGGVEYGLSAQLQRVEQHPIKIPANASEHRIQRCTSLVPLIPAPTSICDAVLQLFQEL